MGKARVVLSQATRAQRKTARQALGRLSTTIVQPHTLVRYCRAATAFFRQQALLGLPIAATALGFDLQVAAYIDLLWEEGEARGAAGDLLSALQHYVPALRRQLNASWRLHRAWGMRELPTRAPPLPLDLVLAMSGVALRWQFRDVAVLLLLGFNAFLRTAELLGLMSSQLVFSPDGMHAVVQLPETKGTARSGAIESVPLADRGLVLALRHACAGLKPGDRLLRRTPAHFRMIFDALLEELGCGRHGFKPYSLRRGGATHFFRETGSLDKTADRGRWRDTRTARIYVNTGLSSLLDQAFSRAQRARIAHHKTHLFKAFGQ